MTPDGMIPRQGRATAAHLAAFSSLLARDADASQLHMRDLQVLALLACQDAPLAVHVIATALGVTGPHISRVAEKLIGRGLLLRVADPLDRRLALLTPTETGRALDDRVRGHYETAALV